jgi:hypothetical protein
MELMNDLHKWQVYATIVVTMCLFGLPRLDLFRLIFSHIIIFNIPVKYYSFYQPNE